MLLGKQEGNLGKNWLKRETKKKKRNHATATVTFLTFEKIYTTVSDSIL